MKEQDKNNFTKSENIANDIMDIIRGEGDGKKLSDLRSCIEHNDYAKDMVDKICDENKFSEISNMLDEAEKNINISSFKLKLDKHNKKITVLRRVAVTLSAAAVLAISFLIYIGNDDTQDLVTESVVNEPVLILNNGEKINLKSLDESLEKDDMRLLFSSKDSRIKYSEVADEGSVGIKYNKLSLPKNCTYSIILSDGSEVYLNACSELEYPVTFNDSIREVKLKGEAYFKVKKSDTPFIVKFNNASVKVYGTEFNINSSYEKYSETVLVSGSVGIRVNGGKEFMLVPNQMAISDTFADKISLQNINVENYISWKSGYFRYTEYSFIAVMNDIAMWYGANFKISDEVKAKNLSVTLSTSRKASLKEMLRFVEKIMPVKIINEGGGNYVIE